MNKVVKNGFIAVMGLVSLAMEMGKAFATTLVDVVSSTASGSIDTATQVAAGPAGTVVYTIVGIGLLITIIGLFLKLRNKAH